MAPPPRGVIAVVARAGVEVRAREGIEPLAGVEPLLRLADVRVVDEALAAAGFRTAAAALAATGLVVVEARDSAAAGRARGVEAAVGTTSAGTAAGVAGAGVGALADGLISGSAITESGCSAGGEEEPSRTAPSSALALALRRATEREEERFVRVAMAEEASGKDAEGLGGGGAREPPC